MMWALMYLLLVGFNSWTIQCRTAGYGRNVFSMVKFGSKSYLGNQVIIFIYFWRLSSFLMQPYRRILTWALVFMCSPFWSITDWFTEEYKKTTDHLVFVHVDRITKYALIGFRIISKHFYTCRSLVFSASF